MRGCSKVVGFLFFNLLAASALAGPAVLIEDSERRKSDQRIESDVQAEPDWNRSDALSEPERSPASVPEAPAYFDPGLKTDESKEEVAPAEEVIEPRQSRRRQRRGPNVGRSNFRADDGYANVAELRRQRRVGAGASFMGRAGFVGLDVELNIHENHSLLASVGGGPGYTGVSLGYKAVPFHSSWHPSFSGAVSAWTSESENFRSGGAIPAFFRPKSEQNLNPRLRAIYLVPGFGIQNVQILGHGAGGMIFAEALFFVDVSTLGVQPLGSVGAKYFF